MSTEKYYPNGEGTNPVYEIGTVGMEYNGSILKTAFNLGLDAARAANPVLGPLLSNFYLSGATDISAL